jgi:hypothetical protein
VLVARAPEARRRRRHPFDRLLALTFTLKAAAEMRDRRIRADVCRDGCQERRASFSGAWILNFSPVRLPLHQGETRPRLAWTPASTCSRPPSTSA